MKLIAYGGIYHGSRINVPDYCETGDAVRIYAEHSGNWEENSGKRRPELQEVYVVQKANIKNTQNLYCAALSLRQDGSLERIRENEDLLLMIALEGVLLNSSEIEEFLMLTEPNAFLLLLNTEKYPASSTQPRNKL